MTIYMPLKAVGKQVGLNTFTGSLYTLKNSREFMCAVKAYGKEYSYKEGVKPENVGNKGVGVEIVFYVKIPTAWNKKKRQAALDGDYRPKTKPDTDNVVKCILDALTQVLYKDDAEVTEHSCKKFYALKPSIEVNVDYL